MRLVLKQDASPAQTGEVIQFLEKQKAKFHVNLSSSGSVIAIPNGKAAELEAALRGMAGVESLGPFSKNFKLASREFRAEDTVVPVGGVVFGGKQVVMMAGPCAVESREQLLTMAEKLSDLGVRCLRGGAFKPRTSPYSFRGLREEGLALLREACDRYGMVCATEVLAIEDIPAVEKFADILQIGARNMQNFDLLEACGQASRPVLLKRGLSSTMEELLMSAEYILGQGNPSVILCERGIRTFEPMTRNTLDVAAVPQLKHLSHLPIIIDPSHAAGLRHLVPALAKSGIAAGADGIIMETHPNPEKALSDGPQSLRLEDFAMVYEECKKVAESVGRLLL